MKKKRHLRSGYYMMAALLFSGFIIQSYGLVRHFIQAPGDFLGIILYLATAVACAFASFLYFIKARDLPEQ